MLLHALNCSIKRVGKFNLLLVALIMVALFFPLSSPAQIRTRSNVRKRIPFPSPIQTKIVEITISPSTAAIVAGGTVQFQATVKNASNTAVQWTSSQGNVSGNGLFTAPKLTAGATLAITATSVADSTKSATASISVTPAVSL